MGMRVPRLMKGDAAAVTEAQLMISEKIEAAAQLQWKLFTGELGHMPPALLDGSVAHYRKAVRRNRRRLSISDR
ncbi:hypothetical protein [Sphingobium yanoikuyae]|nr:hypothetical protein [Sphingobium yanoikuyae]